MKRRQFSALAAATLAAPLVRAQERALRILVGFPPGGSVDVVARLLAERLRPALNQNVIVENKPGAGGRVALQELKRAAPDGQLLCLTPSGALVIQPWLFANLGFDPLKDFSPVSRVTVFDFAVTVGPGAPQGDLKAVLAWMKAHPDKANFATSGAGTVPHFAGVLLSQATGIPMTHVAYRGGAPAAQDLIGGQVPMMIDTLSETLEHHKAGKVRIIAVTGEQRTRSLPDVPTLRELGINTAADDAAGLAITDRMTAQIRALNQSIRNANDAVSMMQTAEGATNEISNMLQRMRELAVQSANDSYGTNDRTALQTENDQLKEEITRIASNTQWNGMSVLNGTIGSAGVVTFQVGTQGDATSSITVEFKALDATTLTVDSLQLDSNSNSQAAIGKLDTAIQTVDTFRATLGAKINRMTSAADNLTNVAMNTSASRSRILDADYAQATTELARSQIIQQAATAMLAQANQQPQAVLSLLK